MSISRARCVPNQSNRSQMSVMRWWRTGESQIWRAGGDPAQKNEITRSKKNIRMFIDYIHKKVIVSSCINPHGSAHKFYSSLWCFRLILRSTTCWEKRKGKRYFHYCSDALRGEVFLQTPVGKGSSPLRSRAHVLTRSRTQLSSL